jgi:hypothetical protein
MPRFVCQHCGEPDIDALERAPRFLPIAIHGPDAPGNTDGAGAAPALGVIQGMLPRDGGRPPAVRRPCRYRAATVRVPAGTRVRHPRCPRCGERLGYRETADGALLLHVHDPAFRLHLVDKAR